MRAAYWFIRCSSAAIGIAISAGDAWSASATSAELSYSFNFSAPVVTKVDGYDRVRMEGCDPRYRTGEPVLPVKSAAILIPQGKEAGNITYEIGNEMVLPGSYYVEPAQKPFPLSKPELAEKTLPNPAIYESPSPYPEKIFSDRNPQMKKGYCILYFNLNPVKYIPAERKLSYYERITVHIALKPHVALEEEIGIRDLKADRDDVRRLINNPGVMGTYTVPEHSKTSPLETYTHAIITRPDLAVAFEPLRDHRIAQGLNSTIVTTEWIYANYSGADNQAKVRNFIKYAYENWDTEYVLLGGYSGIIPVKTINTSGGGETDDIPADLYYGCLDDGAEQDLTYEVNIGRAPVSSAAEVSNFTSKTIAYETSSDAYRKNVSMLAEYLGWGVYYGKLRMEEIRLGSSAHGYTTLGFASNSWFDTSNNLYDGWDGSDLINLINGNVHVLNNHPAHANETYDMKLYTSDLSSLTNSKPFFGYSQGCCPGAFDTTDCWCEVITTMQYGAFAFVGNSRYGWGETDSTDGPSQRYNRPFWHALFGEGIRELGRMNSYSKEYNIYRIEEDCMRWCYYELNLFGDPAVRINAEGFGPTPTPTNTPTEIPTEAPTAAPPAPTPPSSWPIAIAIDRGALAGGRLLVTAVVKDPGQVFDSWVVAQSPGGMYYFFGMGNTVSGKAKVYIAGVPGLPGGWSGVVVDLLLPPGIEGGTWKIHAGLFLQAAIPWSGGCIGDICTVDVPVGG